MSLEPFYIIQYVKEGEHVLRYGIVDSKPFRFFYATNRDMLWCADLFMKRNKNVVVTGIALPGLAMKHIKTVEEEKVVTTKRAQMTE